jgi:histidinol phosphatase-like enzyme (inositol monophosphatase family)
MWRHGNVLELCRRRLRQGEPGQRHGAPAMKRAQKAAAVDYLAFAHELADLAGATVLPYFRRSLAVGNKHTGGGFDPVTVADRAAERSIRAAIAKRFPDHGVVGEEFATVEGAGRHQWIIDPIDGTRAFIMGSPMWGTLIALVDGGKPLLGIMDQPFTRERFWGSRGTSRLRDPDGKVRRLKTRRCGGLADAVLTSTHPDLFGSPGELAAFDRIKTRVRMTRYGCDCYGYCLIAAGFVDIVVEAGLKPHDVAALIPIIEGAGGRITTWDNGPAIEGGCILATGDPRVHKEALALLRA